MNSLANALLEAGVVSKKDVERARIEKVRARKDAQAEIAAAFQKAFTPRNAKPS